MDGITVVIVIVVVVVVVELITLIMYLLGNLHLSRIVREIRHR